MIDDRVVSGMDTFTLVYSYGMYNTVTCHEPTENYSSLFHEISVNTDHCYSNSTAFTDGQSGRTSCLMSLLLTRHVRFPHQELVMAIDSSKPIVVIILDQAAWELLTVPGGAEEAIRDAGDDAWTDGKHAAPLCSYAGEEIIPGVPMSINVMRSLFNRLASINLCPCRELEVENDGYRSVLSRAAEYVQKDLAYFKEHAQLKSKAMAWDQAVRKGGPQPLLQGGEAAFWNGWLQSARTHGMEPQPTEMMDDYVGASMRHSRRRKGLMQCLAVLLIVVLAAGVGVSATMALRAEDAQADAEAQAFAALEALAKADKSARLSTAMASTSIMNRQPFASDWELKLLREALGRLPSPGSLAAGSALLASGRELLAKPSIITDQVSGLTCIIYRGCTLPET